MRNGDVKTTQDDIAAPHSIDTHDMAVLAGLEL
jgi:hypothetical protein